MITKRGTPKEAIKIYNEWDPPPINPFQRHIGQFSSTNQPETKELLTSLKQQTKTKHNTGKRERMKKGKKNTFSKKQQKKKKKKKKDDPSILGSYYTIRTKCSHVHPLFLLGCQHNTHTARTFTKKLWILLRPRLSQPST